jgi:hypothetical protein
MLLSPLCVPSRCQFGQLCAQLQHMCASVTEWLGSDHWMAQHLSCAALLFLGQWPKVRDHRSNVTNGRNAPENHNCLHHAGLRGRMRSQSSYVKSKVCYRRSHQTPCTVARCCCCCCCCFFIDSRIRGCRVSFCRPNPSLIPHHGRLCTDSEGQGSGLATI